MNEIERNMPSHDHNSPVRRFLVQRYYESVDLYFVEAPDATAAKERVYPDDPSWHPYFEGWGGSEVAPLQAAIRDLRIVVREIRRFPGDSIVFYGEPGDDRRVPPEGEPARSVRR